MIELIDSTVEPVIQTDLYKHIERCGRICYKSEDRITDDSAPKFINTIVNRGHTSVLEHGTIYFTVKYDSAEYAEYYDTTIKEIINSPYSFYKSDDSNLYVTTNFRVVLNAFKGNLTLANEFINKHLSDLSERHIQRITLHITCDRAISMELIRHRVFSFSQESTRYCNYGNRGFQFIKPAWWDEVINDVSYSEVDKTKWCDIFYVNCNKNAEDYNKLLELGQTPQQARAVLNNALKTELMMTGTIPQWEEFLKLRLDKAAHPDMQVLAKKIQETIRQV